MGTRDITDHWDGFLKEMFELGSVLKVPGRKAKCKDVILISIAYEQQYLRTMFFDKCEKKKINETTYEITNATQVEIWNCKQMIVDIYTVIDPSMMEMSVNPD